MTGGGEEPELQGVERAAGRAGGRLERIGRPFGLVLLRGKSLPKIEQCLRQWVEFSRFAAVFARFAAHRVILTATGGLRQRDTAAQRKACAAQHFRAILRDRPATAAVRAASGPGFTQRLEDDPMTDTPGKDSPVITIKKYANRRLYNTATSSYVTLEHLAKMVKEGVDFVVLDAKTNEDLTRQVLTQIIIEEEAKGENLLPINFLRQMIGLYGHGMQGLVPRYLDLSMESFSRNQQQIRSYMEDTFTGLFPFGDKINEMGKRNMAMFEDAMKMFTPFPGANSPAGRGAAEPAGDSESPEIRDLKAKLDALQNQLDQLLRAKK
jgi:polyhydroxyalkanoate synthesis repressor PhaR